MPMRDEASVLARFPGGYWQVPAFLDYVQPALTDEALAAAEAHLGVTLPSAYLHLLRQQNGGYLRANSGISSQVNGIGPQFPSITRDEGWWRPKNADAGAWAPTDASLLIPFDGDGHWDMCFDYRRGGPRGEPSITHVDCECEREEPVAADFLDFLAALVDEVAEQSTRIYGGAEAGAVARAIAKHLQLAEPTVDESSSGFPMWRIALHGNAEWCWCGPNRVPKGFRREGTSVIVTDSTALRVPEDPDCCVLLSVTDDSGPTIAAALAALRLQTTASGEAT